MGKKDELREAGIESYTNAWYGRPPGHSLNAYRAGFEAGYASRDEEIERLRAALRHYADESFWDDPHPDLRYAEGSVYNFEDEFVGLMPGYHVAQDALKEGEDG